MTLGGVSTNTDGQVLDVDGAVLFSRWLAGHLGPVLTGLKKENRNAVAEVR